MQNGTDPSSNRYGDFSIFGIIPDRMFLRHELPERLGVEVKDLDVGGGGNLFFHTTYGELFESNEAIVMKLGLAHTAQGEPLSAQRILERRLLGPHSVEGDELLGNTLVAWFSKTSPQFSVYKTLCSTPQLYFSKTGGGILCTDGPRPHLALIDHLAINEDVVAQHFLFRYCLGRHTYFDGIERLLPGELFCWDEGKLNLHLVRDLRRKPGDRTYHQVDSQSLSTLRQEMGRIIGAYVADIKQTGHGLGTMLSGGVDSTLLQKLIVDNLSTDEQANSFSYVVDTPEFAFEVDYAREASELLGTKHTFVPTTPQEFPDLLVETITTLGYPVPAETYPCKLKIAKHVAANMPDIRYFFLGNGADSVYGTNLAKKIDLFDRASHVPASGLMFQMASVALGSVAPKKAHGLRQLAGMLAEINDPLSYKLPMNITAVYTDLEMARHSFGDATLKKALEYRQHLEELYLGSNHYNEKTHMIEVFGDAYECSVVTNHLYLAHKCEQIFPFLDEGIMRIGLAFDPKVRFLAGRKVKPLLKGVLEQYPNLADVPKKRKGASVFNETVHEWMREGPMRELVLSIERPSFLSKSDFESLLTVPTWSELDDPNWFLWNLLIFDIFQKQVINQ